MMHSLVSSTQIPAQLRNVSPRRNPIKLLNEETNFKQKYMEMNTQMPDRRKHKQKVSRSHAEHIHFALTKHTDVLSTSQLNFWSSQRVCALFRPSYLSAR